MHYVQSTLCLLVVYLALTANLQFSNVVLGLLVAFAASLLLRPQPGRTDLRRLPGGVWSAIRYVVILIVDVLKSGIGVARIVLDPALPIRPGIIAIESGCETELGTAISAHAISITPGELVLGIDEAGVLYVHCLDATRSAESATAAQTQRRELLSRIFR